MSFKINSKSAGITHLVISFWASGILLIVAPIASIEMLNILIAPHNIPLTWQTYFAALFFFLVFGRGSK